MTLVRLVALAPVLLVALCQQAEARRRPATLELPLLIRMARCAGEFVKQESWVAEHVAASNRVLEPHNVRLRAVIEPFVPERCTLLTRGDRDALAEHVATGSVTVLVLERVQDVDLPSYDLMGVHWRYGGGEPQYKGLRWIILTARARPPVLAHELGHYLGLRHDPAGGTMMTPGPSDPIWRGKGKKPAPWAPLLTERQAQRVRGAVRRLLAKDRGR